RSAEEADQQAAQLRRLGLAEIVLHESADHGGVVELTQAAPAARRQLHGAAPAVVSMRCAHDVSAALQAGDHPAGGLLSDTEPLGDLTLGQRPPGQQCAVRQWGVAQRPWGAVRVPRPLHPPGGRREQPARGPRLGRLVDPWSGGPVRNGRERTRGTSAVGGMLGSRALGRVQTFHDPYGGTDPQVERRPGAPRDAWRRAAAHCTNVSTYVAQRPRCTLRGAISPRTIVSMLSNSGSGRRRSVLRAVLVAVALVAWLAVGGFGGMAQGEMSQAQENDQAAFLPESAESTQAARVIEKFSTSEDLPALLVVEATDGGGLSSEQIAAVQQFAGKIPQLQLDGGTEVAELLTSEKVPAIPAEDGKAVLVPI